MGFCGSCEQPAAAQRLRSCVDTRKQPSTAFRATTGGISSLLALPPTPRLDEGELLAEKNSEFEHLRAENACLQALVSSSSSDLERLRTSNQELESEVSRLKVVVSQAEELNREQVRIKDEQLQAMPTTTAPDYQAVLERILKEMTTGKGSFASTSPQYKFASRALSKVAISGGLSP